MATSTLHRPQKTGSWSTIFPTEQVTEQQSALFVKKLLAVSISNITYLRTIFPEHAFGDRCLEDLNLKILRDDSACPGACQVIQWVKGCFDALDKQYLRMIVVGIYMDASDPNTVVETYTFKFNYNTQEGITIFRNDSRIASAYTEAETRKATIKLLRTIVVLTQTLKPLPDDVMLTMKLLYYDNVTPPEYEPPGFQATMADDFAFKEEPMNIRVGDVATPFHAVKLRIRTECQQFSLEEGGEKEEEEEGKCGEVKGGEPEAMEMEAQPPPPSTHLPSPTITHPPPPTITHPQPTENKTDTAETAGTPEEPMEEAQGQLEGNSPQQEEDQPVRCPCGCDEDDGLMVLCGECKVWQHAVCFALLKEEDVPELHVCEQCAQSEKEGGYQCTDPFLQFLSPTALQATCLWRRALLACGEMNRVLTPNFAKRLGVEMTVAQGLVNRLEREGFVRPPAKGKRLGKIVNKDKIRNEGIKKYFEKARRDVTSKPQPKQHPQEEVETITEKASSMNLSTSKPIPRKLSALPRLDDDGVRRSPRIAKRVRSLVDESVEFDLSCSQDPDAGIDTNEGRRKRRKASVASRSILV